MSHFSSLLLAVKEKNLSKDKLEDYHADLTNLFAQMSLRMAELEKLEALFLDSSEETTLSGAKRKWNAKPEGQEMIQIKHSLRAAEKMLSSLKSRIYSLL